ncbi:hypothetical protein [Streptomyces sp. bgisy159]|uniref:hypothetical protein n=1 Tax=Streptomyces sp. bgisy159 TaxID=3413795 RepID=UPI003F49E95A
MTVLKTIIRWIAPALVAAAVLPLAAGGETPVGHDVRVAVSDGPAGDVGWQ